jgi:hypothetical protein
MTVKALNRLMSEFIFERLRLNYPNYPIHEYLADLGRRIWSYPEDGDSLTQLEMALQRNYISNLIHLAELAFGTSRTDKGQIKKAIVCGEKGDWHEVLCSKTNAVSHSAGLAAIEQLKIAEKIVKGRSYKIDIVHYKQLYQYISSVRFYELEGVVIA